MKTLGRCTCLITLRVDVWSHALLEAMRTNKTVRSLDLRLSYFGGQPLREGERRGSGVLMRRCPLDPWRPDDRLPAAAKHLPNSATCPTELGNTMPLRRQAEEYHRNRGPAPWKRLRPNLPNTKLRRKVCMSVPTLADARAERAAIAAAPRRVSPMLLGLAPG